MHREPASVSVLGAPLRVAAVGVTDVPVWACIIEQPQDGAGQGQHGAAALLGAAQHVADSGSDSDAEDDADDDTADGTGADTAAGAGPSCSTGATSPSPLTTLRVASPPQQQLPPPPPTDTNTQPVVSQVTLCAAGTICTA